MWFNMAAQSYDCLPRVTLAFSYLQLSAVYSASVLFLQACIWICGSTMLVMCMCAFVSVYLVIPYDPITDTILWIWKKSP